MNPILETIGKLIESQIELDARNDGPDFLCIMVNYRIYFIHEDGIYVSLSRDPSLSYDFADPSFDPQIIVDFLKKAVK